ncbi:unnamed protein product, partial [Rotaria sp. Silwood1]
LRNHPSMIKAKRNNDPSDDINVLLLGQTGVGKSTFINGLANYLCNDTLEEAANDQMQAVIPSAFSFTHDETFEERMIKIGENDEHENYNENGQSCTQQCRSFVFPVGEKTLRIIDAPGIGDTRGLDQDNKNFNEILTFISQYEHLNGICILLKPNEERLTILFRFCINELLRHLHENEHKQKKNIEVPFTRDNTFLLDNEPFRYLALRKNGIRLNNDQILSYQKSWEHTIKEYSNLMRHIVTRPLHAISNTLSLNEAGQLIRKLTHPIAETHKLIQENIQLATQYKKYVLETNIRRLSELPSLSDIDKRINDLTHEKSIIEDVYKKLSKFFCANATLPFNDAILQYHSLFIKEEQMKKKAGRQNDDVIQGLEQMMKVYEEEINLFKKTIENEKDRSYAQNVLKSDDIFPLVETLYRLPINGSKICEQVDGLKISQINILSKREVVVELPVKADLSSLMSQFKIILNK